MTNERDWLVGRRFQMLIRRESDWVLTFDEDARIDIGCLWRLLEGGRVRFTSLDHGHQFGLPAPVNAVLEVTNRLTLTSLEMVKLSAGTLDLELRFSSGHIFQIIPDSAGYEAWNAMQHNKQFIAVGGGDLAIFT